MTDRELLQQALVALEYLVTQTRPVHSTDTAIEALKARLAQPEPEPVAWVYPRFWDDLERVNCGTAYRNPTVDREPLYTAPPQREWQGLTNEEVNEAAHKCVKSGQSVNAAIRAIEAKLKEKNEKL